MKKKNKKSDAESEAEAQQQNAESDGSEVAADIAPEAVDGEETADRLPAGTLPADALPADTLPADAVPEDELTVATRERDSFESKWQRAVADLENFKRRQRKEIVETRQRAIEGLTAELLPVLDNFHLALGAQSASDSSASDPSMIVEGLKMVRSMLEGTLERHGLSEIPSEGKPFDPNVHEAVGIDSESDAEPGIVTRIMQPGYKIGDKVLRASRVLVSGEAQTESPESD